MTYPTSPIIVSGAGKSVSLLRKTAEINVIFRCTPADLTMNLGTHVLNTRYRKLTEVHFSLCSQATDFYNDRIYLLTFYLKISGFKDPEKEPFKTVWEKEKMLFTSHLIVLPAMFYSPIKDNFCHL